jgi:hypothetical protein
MLSQLIGVTNIGFLYICRTRKQARKRVAAPHYQVDYGQYQRDNVYATTVRGTKISISNPTLHSAVSSPLTASAAHSATALATQARSTTALGSPSAFAIIPNLLTSLTGGVPNITQPNATTGNAGHYEGAAKAPCEAISSEWNKDNNADNQFETAPLDSVPTVTTGSRRKSSLKLRDQIQSGSDSEYSSGHSKESRSRKSVAENRDPDQYSEIEVHDKTGRRRSTSHSSKRDIGTLDPERAKRNSRQLSEAEIGRRKSSSGSSRSAKRNSSQHSETEFKIGRRKSSYSSPEGDAEYSSRYARGDSHQHTENDRRRSSSCSPRNVMM